MDDSVRVSVVRQSKLFAVLLSRMRQKQQFSAFDSIQLYLSELLCIYLQPMKHAEGAETYASFAAACGCDNLLSLLSSQFSEKEPALSEEKEYALNLTGALSAALASTVNQQALSASPTALATLLSLLKRRNLVRQGCL